MPNSTSFIAQRLYFSQPSSRSAVRPAVRVALLGIIIGVMVMVVTIGVVVGFKQTVANKVAGFGSHVQVVNYDNNNTYEMLPITWSDSLIDKLSSYAHVKAVAPFYTKPGIAKTDSDFQGVVFKGTTYWDYFLSNLVEGTLPANPNEVIISRRLADKLQLKTESAFLLYFVNENVKARKVRVTGIYHSGVGELDDTFIIGLPAFVLALNQWTDHQASGIEVMVDDLRYLHEVGDDVYFATANRLDAEGNAFYTQNVEQLNPQIFAWLDLLDMNVIVIIILMLAVAGFNIISGLIILILDSIQLIGTLKALGATNGFVKRIFIKQALMLIGKGMLIGNALGLGLCYLQYATHLLPLDATSYYVDFVPISFAWGWIIVLNIATVLISMLILLLPAAIISHISPAQVMKFE